jgi:ABC-2 type transport system ATP-binding protein
MEPSFGRQLREVQGHFQARDYDLAHRRLLDCVLETRDLVFFSEALDYCSRQEAQPNEPEQLSSRAMELLQRLEQARITPVPGGPVVVASGLRKTYSLGNFSLEGVDCQLHSRHIIGLVGENGQGKTTLLRLLARELQPDGGSIQYHCRARPRDDYELRSRIMYVEQRIPRWYGSLIENLQFTLTHYGIRGQHNLLWAELMIARLGLRPYRQLSWNRLSSGYRTRFELAKTLLRQPQLLLLDEPLANLDIQAQQTILQDLRFMSRSLTAPFGMMLSSQHIYEVEKVSDHIIFLQQGKARYQGASREEPAQALVIELEADCSRETLAAAFAGLPLQQMRYNGGVFLLYFDTGTEPARILEALAAHRIDLSYLRNISHSSRRFFIP